MPTASQVVAKTHTHLGARAPQSLCFFSLYEAACKELCVGLHLVALDGVFANGRLPWPAFSARPGKLQIWSADMDVKFMMQSWPAVASVTGCASK